MRCPKCQFENITEARLCEDCGHKLQLVCPNCGFAQAYSEECVKCGIIIKKYMARKHADAKRYEVKMSYILFIRLLIAGSFTVGGMSFLFRNRVPGGVEAALAITVLSAMFGIVFVFLYVREKTYFVSLTETELNIANQKVIPWEQVYNVEWKDDVDNHSGFEIRSQWINIYYSDEVNQRVAKITITHKIEEIKELYQQILKRVSCDADGLRNSEETNIRMLVEWGAWWICLLAVFLFIVAVPEGEAFELMSRHSIPALMIGVLFALTGILLMVRWRK